MVDDSFYVMLITKGKSYTLTKLMLYLDLMGVYWPQLLGFPKRKG